MNLKTSRNRFKSDVWLFKDLKGGRLKIAKKEVFKLPLETRG